MQEGGTLALMRSVPTVLCARAPSLVFAVGVPTKVVSPGTQVPFERMSRETLLAVPNIRNSSPFSERLDTTTATATAVLDRYEKSGKRSKALRAATRALAPASRRTVHLER
jgi:hypothetical protein